MGDFLALQALPRRNVPDLLGRSRRFGLDRPFVLDLASDTALAYGAFLARVAGAAAALAERFPAGALIAVMLANKLDTMILRYALSCAGLVEVALNPAHRGEILRGMLETARPAAIVLEGRFRAGVETSGFDLGGVALIEEGALAALCALQRDWEDRPRPALGPGTAGRVIFTSGTTGVSKGAELSHAYEVYTGERIIHRLGFGPDDRCLYVTPIFHVDALVLVSALLHSGGAFVMAPDFSASRFWEDVARSGATSFVYVGSILAILLKGDGPPGAHTLRSTVGGGCPEPVWEEFQSRFGVRIIEAYAMTESIACVMNSYDEQRFGSVGRPLPGYEVMVADGFGRPLPPDEKGEILIRSTEPHGFMTGYLDNPAATAEKIRDFWFHTGDLGAFDADGWLYYHGRLKDVIRRRSENISAAELESVADRHPGVWISAAVGVPSELGEEEVMLYVQPKEGTSVEPADICDFIAANAAPFMVPRFVRIVDRLPLTPTEKVAKAALSREPDAETWVRPG